jgi:hypothetical protein
MPDRRSGTIDRKLLELPSSDCLPVEVRAVEAQAVTIKPIPYVSPGKCRLTKPWSSGREQGSEQGCEYDQFDSSVNRIGLRFHCHRGAVLAPGGVVALAGVLGNTQEVGQVIDS